MRLIDFSFQRPADNLALEEVLLDEVEQGHEPDTLRLWESPTPFVVLGTGQRLAQEVYEAHCVADGVPILRRCTAGGCVLQGPGSLNYALFLSYERHPEVASLHGSYRHLIGGVCQALATLGIQASHEGISDIALEGRKVSGNAQRRRRRALLHHGTLLYHADIRTMARYLQEPEDRPDYRATRNHADFLTVLDTSATALRNAICAQFAPGVAPTALTSATRQAATELAARKYDSHEWTHRR